MQITIRNDRLIAEMGARAAKLIELTEQARERQHASNADIVASLTESDRRLRFARDIVDRANEMRAALAAVPAGGAGRQAPAGDPARSSSRSGRAPAQLRPDLVQLLREHRARPRRRTSSGLHAPTTTAATGRRLPVDAATTSAPAAAGRRLGRAAR